MKKLTTGAWAKSVISDRKVYGAAFWSLATVPAAAALNQNPSILAENFALAHAAINVGAIYSLGKLVYETCIKYEINGRNVMENYLDENLLKATRGNTTERVKCSSDVIDAEYTVLD